MRDAVHLGIPTGVQVDRDTLARAHEITVGVIAVEDERLRLGVADATAELRRGAFLDLELHIDEVGRTRDGGVLGFHLLDVRQALQTLLGAFDEHVGQPTALELTHFAAQHLVVDLGDAVEHDVAYVHAITRIHEERETHFLLRIVAGRHRVNLGERVTFEPEAILDQLLRVGDLLLREGLARLHEQIVLQLCFGHDEGAGELHRAHFEDLALGDVDRDEDVVLLGSDRDLRRVDLEVRVTAVHVVRAQFFEIALQRLARVPIVLPVPGEPVRRLELEVLEDVFFGVGLVAHHVDLADAGALAFLDVDFHPHAVVGHFLDLRIDAHGVLAAAEILVGEELLDVLEHRAIEGLARGEPYVTQALGEILGLDVLVALEFEALDRRPFEHGDDQRAALPAQLHVAEKVGVVERADRFAHALRRQSIADIHRQVVVHRAFRDALQTLDADVVDAQRLRHRRLLRRRLLRRRLLLRQ